MKDTQPYRVRFGAFELDLKSGELCVGDEKTVLPEQPLRVLRMLIEREGEIVLREEIRKKLWPNDTIVEFDHSINAAINKLRKALDDSADEPQYIATVARRGYRLMTPVERVPREDSSDPTSTPAARSGQAISVKAAENSRASVAGGDGAAVRMQPEPGALTGRTVSHYRVLDVIGGGGMGVVYRAEDLRLGRRVALKFLPEELGSDAQALERFSREARAASALDHPNICSIYQFGEHDGRPFIAMQLLEGETLRDRLASAGEHGSALPLGELLDIGIQVSEGLQAAHEKGIIHRDIKPANIFITTKGVCKILDFGLAKLLEGSNEDEVAANPAAPATAMSSASAASHLTRIGAAVGTAGYMSPEQVRGEKLDARSDLFSFGVILYEMATGRGPFSSQTAAILHDAILSDTPLPVHELNSTLPAKIEQIINKALEKDREQRYQTTAELRSALQRLRSDTDSERAVALSESRRRWPLWVAGLLAMLLAALAVAWFEWRRLGPRPEVAEQQLTANPLEDWVSGAAISPDGKYLAYHDQTGLYLRSIDSGETHPVSLPAELRSRIFTLCWFPGGAKLLAGVAGSDGYDIWVITVLGEAEPYLLYGHAEEPAISPDGRMIAFTSGDVGKLHQEMWVGGINGEAPRKLVDVGELEKVFSPVWSPDGRWIAYGRQWQTAPGSWSSAIEVRPARGGPAKTLVAESGLPKSSTPILGSYRRFTEGWSPKWRLVFSVSEGPESLPAQTKYSLWEARVDPRTGEATGRPERLTQWGDFEPGNLTITADGKRLSLVKFRFWWDVYLGELRPGGASMEAPRRLTLDDRGSDASAWTHDGQAILFDSNRNGKREIFRQGLNENIAEVIVSGPGDVYGGEMSPDGAWFLYMQSEATRRAGEASSDSVWLMRRATGGGSPEMVLAVPHSQAGDPNGFHCSSNPKASSPCVLGLHEGKDLVFYSLDPVRGKGSRLGKIEVTEPARWIGWGVSPDGTSLALVDRYKYGGRIEVLTLADGTWHEVALEPAGEHLQSIAWAADGKSFFVTSWAQGSFSLLHVISAGKVQPLLRNSRGQWLNSPLPTPDGKYLAYQGLTFNSNVWMIENF